MKKRSTSKRRAATQKKRKPRGRSAAHRKNRGIGRGIFKATILFGLIVGLSGAFVFGYNYIISSPYLKLKRIQINGVDEKTKRELIRISELHTGLSLLSLNLTEVKRKTESHEWIRSVNLERRFPHTLVINVEPQEPIALVLLDKLYFMNSAGELFKELDNQDDPDFPVITGLSGEDPEAAEKLKSAAQALDELDNQPPPWSLANLSEMHLKNYDRVSMYFRGLEVEIKATLGNLEQRMEGLRKVTAYLEKAGKLHRVATIDLNQSGDAVVSFKKS